MTGWPVIAFVPAEDQQRALAFYTEVLGARFLRDDGFALVCEAGGTMLRIVEPREFSPQPFTVLGFEVEDVDAEVARLAAAGVRFEHFGLAEDGAAWEAPNGDRVAWFHDTEGNLLSLSAHVEPVDPG
ncbi:VOC family protein [Demequina pelophila]|uniref:VOC family protein n=1 Tax=Demequina pelophila TaxID=1638984 RepID=UPI000784DC97|nr:VOC family protein [Demequina pelophila]